MVSKKIIKLKNRIIGENQKTFIIAEAGINHNGNMKIAKKMISEAKKAGADAIKFQTYLTEKRVKKGAPIFYILKKCELSQEQTKELNQFCKNQDIIFFSTPFDEESIEFLHTLNVPLFKVASFDIVNKSLLRKIASKKTPVIFSRGMGSENEIREAISILENAKTPYAILHCVSSYPTNESDANLNIINTLKSKFNCPIGYSDHTLGNYVPSLSVVLGACIIEKHFTLDKNMEGPDQKISCNPNELKNLVKQIRQIESIMGNNTIRLLECEKSITQYRRQSF